MKTQCYDWGYELWLVNKEYCGKMIYFYKNRKTNWAYHKTRDKTIYVQSGRIRLIYSKTDDIKEAKEITLNSGMSFNIGKELRHQIISLEVSEVFEISTHADEKDIYTPQQEVV